jgi:hypothetical protein
MTNLEAIERIKQLLHINRKELDSAIRRGNTLEWTTLSTDREALEMAVSALDRGYLGEQ